MNFGSLLMQLIQQQRREFVIARTLDFTRLIADDEFRKPMRSANASSAQFDASVWIG
jgi:hypothetical protein